MKRIVFLLVIALCFALMGCQKIVTEETIEVQAIVTDKAYKSAYVTMIPVKVGNVTTMVPQNHPAKYYITVTYEDLSETFDNKALYEELCEGDVLTVIFYRAYNEERQLVRKEIRLPG